MELSTIEHLQKELKADCHGCYQLLGVDIILGEDLRAKVIEVNGIPSMQLGQKQGGLKKGQTVFSDYTQLKINVTQDIARVVTGRPIPEDITKVLAHATGSESVGAARRAEPGETCCVPSPSGTGGQRCYRPADCSQIIRLLTARANRGYFTDLWPGLAPNKEHLASKRAAKKKGGRGRGGRWSFP